MSWSAIEPGASHIWSCTNVWENLLLHVYKLLYERFCMLVYIKGVYTLFDYSCVHMMHICVYTGKLYLKWYDHYIIETSGYKNTKLAQNYNPYWDLLNLNLTYT